MSAAIRSFTDMTTFLRDLLYAARQFRRSPALFAVAVLLIVIGIAANTLIFTLVNALLLRPLPVRDPQNLVQLFEIVPKRPAYPYFDYSLYKQLAGSSPTLFQVIAQWDWTLALDRGSSTERSHVYAVTGNFFTDLGIRPLRGRVFDEKEDHVAVASFDYWLRNGRDPNLVGQTVRLKGHSYRIIGVTPQGFTGTIVDTGPDLWIPIANTVEFSSVAKPNLDNFAVEIVARLRSGVTLAQSQQETAAAWYRYMQDAAAREPQNYRAHLDARLEVRPITNGVSPFRDQSHSALILLLAGTGLLLLMICANIGGLLLARATKREKETAVRFALGASRRHIVRQWFMESLLLASIGGGGGLVLSYASLPLLAHWLPPARGIGVDPAELRTLSLDLHPDLRVAAFSIGLCVLTTVLAAIAPAWRFSRRDLYLVLKTIGDARQRRIQAGLCTVQVALCTVLLISAGLMTRSLHNLWSVQTGFDPDHVVIFSVDPHVRGYDSQQAWSLERRLIEGAQSVPGVENASLANRALMRGIGLGNSVVLPGQHGDGIINTSSNSVSPEYFNVMGMHILAGRGLTENDVAEQGKMTPVIVNEAFVRRFLGNGNPIGRLFATGKEFIQPEYEVVGVVNDTHYRSLREIPPPTFYYDGFGPKAYPDTFVLHVRAHGDPRFIIQPIRDLLRGLDPSVPFFQVATLAEEVDRSLWQERLLAALTSGLSIFAMGLTAIGLYGIVAYFVAARRQEIGLRLALGANSCQLAWLVVRRVVPPMAAGMFAGLILSFFAAAWIQTLLYGVQPFDHVSVGIAVSLLVVVGAGAATTPALRAIRLDPASTLRED